jgi:hypothetical protein
MFHAQVAILSFYLTSDKPFALVFIVLFDLTWNSLSASNVGVLHVRAFPTVVGV